MGTRFFRVPLFLESIMSIWLDDLKKQNPKLAADYAICGNQDSVSLRNMVRALELCRAMNTTAENTRLAAAKRILRATRNG
jgi:uncharacterized Fe-S radical SAM superfamily protein PflX